MRAGAILYDEGKLALIERRRGGETYYLLPGGTVEEGETPEAACVREIREELNLDVEITAELASLTFRESLQRYYLCRMTGGTFGKGDGPEYSAVLPPERGTYEPVWVPLDELSQKDVRPKCVISLFLACLASGFTGLPRRYQDLGDGLFTELP